MPGAVLHAGSQAVDHTVPEPQGRLLCSFFGSQGGAGGEDFLEEVRSPEAEDVNWGFQWGNDTVISLTTLA